jgi:hypothetical protein
MTQEVGQLAAATTHVPPQAQFAMAGIKSQKLLYANTLANLPKQVLWTSWTQLTFVTTQVSCLMISKKFCWGSLARVSGNRIQICCVSSWEWMASSLAFLWEN